MSEQTMDLSQVDDDTLIGHYLLAAVDQRFDDHESLGHECIRRGLCSPDRHEQSSKRLEEQADELRLSRPIVAAPEA